MGGCQRKTGQTTKKQTPNHLEKSHPAIFVGWFQRETTENKENILEKYRPQFRETHNSQCFRVLVETLQHGVHCPQTAGGGKLDIQPLYSHYTGALYMLRLPLGLVGWDGPGNLIQQRGKKGATEQHVMTLANTIPPVMLLRVAGDAQDVESKNAKPKLSEQLGALAQRP